MHYAGRQSLASRRRFYKDPHASAQTVDMDIVISEATANQSALLARHRCEMFREMGTLADEHYHELLLRSKANFELVIPAGNYVAFLACPADAPDTIVGGGGVLIRPSMPRPAPSHLGVIDGEQALILNMFVEPPYRRRGIALAILDHILAWCEARGTQTIILHASVAGRPVYEQRGFKATNEMGVFLAGPNRISL
jgi:GNAT superfamily N-acetyltransferase